MESSAATADKTNKTSKFEWLVNVAIIFIAGYLLFSLARTYLPWGRPQPAEPAQPGAHLTLPEVEWTGGGQALVLALSTDCHFCSESAPLYQRLARELSGRGGFRLMAVLPQPVEEGREYLRKLNVAVDEVHQVDLSTLKLHGTPTLLLTDGAGTITDMWTGKLEGKREHELLERLQLEEDADAPSESFVSASDLQGMLKDKNLVVVDVADRDMFNVRHLEGAVNIPLDELEVRAANELRPENKVVVYCHICERDGESDIARNLLMRSGFKQVSVLQGGLNAWESRQPRNAPADPLPGSAGAKAGAARK